MAANQNLNTLEYKIIPFHPNYALEFERLNKQWIEKYFKLEAIDQEVLSDPQTQVIDPGGQIFFAVTDQGCCLGTCALKRLSENQVELVKMGVEENLRGLGVGQKLIEECLKYAKTQGFKSVLIISNTSLKAAIHLYKKNGFQVTALNADTDYERGDIVLELKFH